MSSKPARILHDGVEFIIQYREDIAGFEGGVVTKQIKSTNESTNLIYQLENEMAQTSDLSIPGVRKALQLSNIEGKTTLFLEYFSGSTLRETFKSRNLNIIDFLKTAISISKILGELHSNKVIHKDINSKNILVSDDLRNVIIIDLGISTKLNLKSDYLVSPERLEGSLAYISPEQTCRMNRVVDYRSDLYSLGVVFFEILTGRLPFEASDPMEFIHCHIAKKPPEILEISPNISPVLGELVMKLLEKNAEDRYQSALGVKNDLEIILEQITKTGKAVHFNLAQSDFSGRFLIHEKLYGRETELKMLMDSFKLVTEGDIQVNLVTGFSGAGKSSLVHEIHKPITEQRGFFIEGKFEQFQRNIPYQAFIQAFKSFIQQMLTKDEFELIQWKKRLKEVLGENAGLITSLIPEFELIVGKYEKPAILNPLESQNRFNYTFLHCLKEMANPEHPLVLFMDDMQWTDLASLALLRQIILDDSIKHLLLILSYRDNETTSDHPFMVLLAELQEQKKNLNYIRLKGLTEVDIGKILTDTLNSNSEKVKGLSKMVAKKTDGNPYFINEFLRSLHTNDLIFWNKEKSEWYWDEFKINETTVTENVVEFLARRILSFPYETLRILQIASCIGNKFDVSLLTQVTEYPKETILEYLKILMEEGYIIPYHHSSYQQFEECRFAHDRFQQAVYSLIQEVEKTFIHYKIGQELLKRNEGQIEKNDIFELVNHLNEARVLIKDHEAIENLCHLNYEAGTNAKNSNAHKDALHYFRIAVSLLQANAWLNFDFTFNLLLAKAEAEYLNLNISEADRNIDELILKARNDIEKAILLERKLINYVTLGKHKEALEVSRTCLGILGVHIPSSTFGKAIVILREMIKVRFLLRNKKTHEILDLPELSSEKGKLIASVLSQTVTPAYFYSLPFYVLLIFIMVNFSLQNGNSKTSAHAYISLGVLYIAMFRNYSFGYEISKISLELNKKYPSLLVRGQLTANLIGGVYHWVLPLKKAFEEFYEGYKFSVEAGDFNYSSMNVCTTESVYLKSGRNLLSIFDEFEDYRNFIERTKDNKVIWEHKLYSFTINELNGRITEAELVNFEKSYVVAMKSTNFNLGYFYTLRTMNNFILGNKEKAVSNAKKALSMHMYFRASPLDTYCIFFGTLALTSNYENNDFWGKLKTKLRLRQSVSQFEKLQNISNENFSCYKYILKAELYKIQGNPTLAIGNYKSAISEANTYKFIHIEAIAYELLGKYCLVNNLDDANDIYLKRAIELYSRWGASLKVNLLYEEFPKLKVTHETYNAHFSNEINAKTESGTMSSANLDLVTVMKSSVALAGKVRFEDLINTLMKILVENAGAQFGYFILEKEKEFMTRKFSELNNGNINLYIGIPEDEKVLPLSLLQYVTRTKEVVVIDDAERDIRFISDEYIANTKPKSILCMPILSKGELTGLIYLENNLIEGAFTKNRIDLMKMLSGQITVSIENSLLYENLEQKVKQRTSQLSDEKKKSDDLLLNILPEEIAEELKLNGQSEAKLFENVTVLFTDFVNFTGIGEKMSPKELVQELHLRFTAFDAIMDKYGLEKIKTIGDAYLAVGGLPIKRTDHAEKVIEAALELQHYIQQKDSKFQVRIGVHSGAVVAGIVGVKKFAYDIWGDTVNTASRMESSSEPGKINISETTFNLIKDKFNCTPRGKIEVKGKGEIDMYFVNGKI